jgi:hypothetical protein
MRQQKIYLLSSPNASLVITIIYGGQHEERTRTQGRRVGYCRVSGASQLNGHFDIRGLGTPPALALRLQRMTKDVPKFIVAMFSPENITSCTKFDFVLIFVHFAGSKN